MKRILFSVLLTGAVAVVASVAAQVPPPKDAEAVLSKSVTGNNMHRVVIYRDAAGRQHSRCEERIVDQHDRRAGARRGLD